MDGEQGGGRRGLLRVHSLGDRTMPEPEPEGEAAPSATGDAGLLRVVRELRAREATMGVKKMVTELKSLHPAWGGQVVSAKTVREAVSRLEAEVAGDAGASAAAARTARVEVLLSGKQRKKIHSAIGGAVSRVAAAAPPLRPSALHDAVRSLDQAAPRDTWVREWGGGLRAHCGAAEVFAFGAFILAARGTQQSVPAAVAVELAIACLKQVLEVRTREAYPEDWARTQMNLGNAYRRRIRGDAASNKEAAIGCYEQALEVYTREAYPEDWARTQVNLGAAYGERIRGDAASNKEAAIGCFEQALEVYTREAYPEYWASTQGNLGTAYGDRIRGDAASNKEAAIGCFEQALEVYTREAYPEY